MFGIYSKIKKQVDGYLGIGDYQIPPDIKGDKIFLRFHKICQPYTLTKIEAQYGLYSSIKYLVNNKIQGSIVECGVFKGGSMMLSALTLKYLGDTKRDIYLYDTYQGMTKPSKEDIDIHGEKAINVWNGLKEGEYSSWTKAGLEEVKSNMKLTRYPENKIKFVVGKVEDTIPKQIPKKIALLRLDTDWYESTKHELSHLFPLLAHGGILIIDDYGHFSGSKKAVDEYFSDKKVYLHRIDYSVRLIVKSN